MHTKNIYKACHRWCAAVYFSGLHGFIGFSSAAIGNSRHGHGKYYSQNFLKQGYSTSTNSLDCSQEDARATDSPAEDICVAPPPEDLMQNLGKEDQRKLKILWMELEVLRQQGRHVPWTMSVSEWQEAMEQPSRSQRLKFYRYRCITEARKEERKRKQIEAAQGRTQSKVKLELARSSDYEAYMRTYGLYKNTLFLRIDHSTMNHVYNGRLCQAMLFGQSIVIDLGYAEHMTKFEYSNCVLQISNLCSLNKMNRQPFNLHFCNAGQNKLMQALEKSIPNLYSETCFITVTEKSYVDVFSRKKLVYLTPHCENDLEEYDHDAVYIIGGFVDKRGQPSISLAKAKHDGVAMARLPLDRYLEWGKGKKTLSLVGVMNIMLDMKNTGCWTKALQHIPKRNLKYDDSVDR